MIWFGWVLVNHCRLFNALYTCILNIYEFYGIATIVVYLMPNPLYTDISRYIRPFSLVAFYGIHWLSLCKRISQILFYIYIKYIRFGLVGFYGISTIVGYLMPNPLYTYVLNLYYLVWLFYGISTLVGNLMQILLILINTVNKIV